jgi:hypothetical protein
MRWISGAAMVLNEEHNEQNQQIWLSRVARERQDLSVSVAETLGVSIQEEFSWSDDDDRDYAEGYSSAHDASVVPPRLSLQSRVVETAPSASGPQAGLSSSAVVPSSEVGGRKSDTPTQNSNILTRFAQRLTASFGALNVNMQEASPATMGQAAQTPPLSFERKASSLASIADIEVCTASTMTGSMVSTRQPFASATAHTSGNSVQTRQRLAGRTTRIRLEVVPGPDGKKIASTNVRDDRPCEITEANTTGMRLPIASLQPRQSRSDPGSTSAHMPALNAYRDAVGLTSAHIRAVETAKDPADAAGTYFPAFDLETPGSQSLQGALSGTACFERGQRELTVSNSSVSASSVVLVTLITNPGPVVVQYISLQPQAGFTVHLTAPPSTDVTFNYVVLLAELF